MGILVIVAVGVVIGWLAGLISGGSRIGLLGDLLVGVVGALIGGAVSFLIFDIQNPLGSVNLSTITLAFIGSVVFVSAIRRFSEKSRLS